LDLATLASKLATFCSILASLMVFSKLASAFATFTCSLTRGSVDVEA
jgi:hypothetical protein